VFVAQLWVVQASLCFGVRQVVVVRIADVNFLEVDDAMAFHRLLYGNRALWGTGVHEARLGGVGLPVGKNSYPSLDRGEVLIGIQVYANDAEPDHFKIESILVDVGVGCRL
jgi:hypothetical protein